MAQDHLSGVAQQGGEPPEPSETGRRDTLRLHSLTGLRAIGALVVFLLHSEAFQVGPVRTILAPFNDQGRLGVAFFFILSGFVLTWSWRPTDRARDFYRRRFARIYPAYIVALVVALLGLVILKGQLPIGQFVVAALLLQSWVPSSDFFYGVSQVSWSLSDEAFFYACFPLLLPVLVRVSQRRRWQLLAGLVFIAFVGRGAVALFANDTLAAAEWPIHILPVTRLIEFLAGALVALQFLGGWRPRVPLWVAGLLAGAAYTIASVAPDLYIWEAVVLAPFSLLIVTAADADVSGRSSWLRGRGWVVAGEISYSFYLVHQIVFRTIRGIAPDDMSLPLATAALLGSFAAAVSAAWLLFRLVEVPMDRRLKGSRRQLA